MSESTPAEAILAANHFCILGTLRKDGRARLSPMAYSYEDGKIIISTTRTRAGAVTAKRDPRVSVCCFNPEQRRPYVTVYGRAEVVEDEAATIRLFSTLRGRPIEGDELETEKRRLAEEGRVVLRITPEEFFTNQR